VRSRSRLSPSARSLLRRVFRTLFGELLGESCLRILELQLRNHFSEDPYKILCQDPKKFCRELKAIFGEGLNPLLRATAKKLVNDYSLNEVRVERFVSRLESGEPVGDELLELLAEASEKLIERIAPGAVLLERGDRSGVAKLIEFAENCGGIEEHVLSRPGWAIRIGKVIVFGIRFADKRVPVAIYSRKYARFRQLANEWVKGTLDLLKNELPRTGFDN